ncbi:MAG: dipicolinate synthase subunit B [Clostridium sp.]|jgi:dipicolinate synthase subunit B|nr:dipicolinate synthase subunit B [Clostridium sp.]
MAKIAFCVTGSFCSFAAVFPVMEELCAAGHELRAIFSANAYSLDTRFGLAADWVSRAEKCSGKEVWHTIPQAEPIGPGRLFDCLIIAPCTGGSLGKLARGITDTAVTMAAKAQLRNERPVLIGVATNDGLSGSAQSLGRLLNARNIYFIPFGQDDAQGKPRSLVADFGQTAQALEQALLGRQIQPLLAKK